jgi:hypothetical protein
MGAFNPLSGLVQSVLAEAFAEIKAKAGPLKGDEIVLLRKVAAVFVDGNATIVDDQLGDLPQVGFLFHRLADQLHMLSPLIGGNSGAGG